MSGHLTVCPGLIQADMSGHTPIGVSGMSAERNEKLSCESSSFLI